MKRITTLLAAMFVIVMTTNAFAVTPLSQNRHIWLHMENGAQYNKADYDTYGGSDYDAYWLKADGGGLNQLHIAVNPSTNINGEDTTTNQTSGTFYITTTGGRGYNDDVILLITVKGTIDPSFSATITSSGYGWTPPANGYGNYPSNPGTYAANYMTYTFGPSDFRYGSNPYKPGPGTLVPVTWSLPLFTGQTDFTTNETLIFVDLKRNNQTGSTLTDKGSVKVDYSFSNLTTSASFNAYSWCKTSNQGQGINWTQNTLGTGTSSYTVTP